MDNQESRLRDSDRVTRVHLTPIDRFKFLIIFAIVWFVLVWASMADNPILSFTDAAYNVSLQRKWIFVLVLIEVLRQLHFLVSELAAPYHRGWGRYFLFVDRLVHKISDWNRYRISRAVKFFLWVALLAVTFVRGAAG